MDLTLQRLNTELAAPTEAEIDQAHRRAERINKAVEVEAIPPNTQLALKSTQRYWQAWYWATFGAALPLGESPPAPVPADAVLMFLADHTPRADDKGRLYIEMPERTRARLAALEQSLEPHQRLTGRRRVAHRARRAGDAEVPSLATVQLRISLLGKLHELLGLPRPQDVDARIRAQLRAIAKSVKERARPATKKPKRALTIDELFAMVAAAGDTPDALRDRALLLTGFFSGGRRRSELAEMQIEDLSFGTFDQPDGTHLVGYQWTLHRMKGRRADTAEGGVFKAYVVAEAGNALGQWLDWLRSQGVTGGPVFRRLTQVKQKDSSELAWRVHDGLTAQTLAGIVKRFSEAVGIDPGQIGGHSLRSGFVTASLDADYDALTIGQMTGQSPQTVALYDQRKAKTNPLLALGRRVRPVD